MARFLPFAAIFCLFEARKGFFFLFFEVFLVAL